MFYLVNDEETRELSVLDAFNYFKASPEEKPVARLPQHHSHVEKAVEKFKATKMQELQEEEANQNQRNNLGAQVTTAVSLINSMMPHIEDGDTRLKLVQLKELAVLESTGYIFVPLLSWLVLKEEITKRTVLAILLIISGIIVFYL